MSEQQLNGAHVDAGFEKMHGKRVLMLCGVMGLAMPEAARARLAANWTVCTLMA